MSKIQKTEIRLKIALFLIYRKIMIEEVGMCKRKLNPDESCGKL